MSFEIMNISTSLIQKHAVAEIENCNEYTAHFGLTLTHTEAIELAETRALSLKNNGRIEFGGGAINKLIKGFCDSPYITKYNYAETINELTEVFYFYKNETLDLMSDDELIEFMKQRFDGICQGSLELLAGRELFNMAGSLRNGLAIDCPEEKLFDEEDEDGEY